MVRPAPELASGLILPSGEVSIARLLDELRDRVAAARDASEHPRSVLVHPRVYRAVQACKAYEARHYQPVRVLGLDVLSSESVSEDTLRLT